MLPVVWLEDAITDLTQIITFVAGENPSAARRLKTRLEAAPFPLTEHPDLYQSLGCRVSADYVN